MGQEWCEAAGVDKIAYIGEKQSPYGNPIYSGIYTIPASGGTPTLICSINSLNRTNGYISNSQAWSNDGTKIAFAEFKYPSTTTIKVIDLSGNVLTTLNAAGTTIQWSHAGMDKLVYSGNVNGVTGMYTIGTTSGSTPTFVTDTGGTPFWSPNNSEVIYYASKNPDQNTRVYKINVATKAKTFLGTKGSFWYGDWKQP